MSGSWRLAGCSCRSNCRALPLLRCVTPRTASTASFTSAGSDCGSRTCKLRRLAGVSAAGVRSRNPERSVGPQESEGSRTCKLRRFADVSAAGVRNRNPERSEGPQRSEDSRTCKLRRFAGVSAAGVRSRNPERSEGPQRSEDSRTCKPNSVCLAAGRSFLWAGHYCAAQATYPEVVTRRAGTRPRFLAPNSLPIWSCSVWGLPCPPHYCSGGALLPHLFTLT